MNEVDLICIVSQPIPWVAMGHIITCQLPIILKYYGSIMIVMKNTPVSSRLLVNNHVLLMVKHFLYISEILVLRLGT